MRVYNIDGTIKSDQVEDVNFGWDCHNISRTLEDTGGNEETRKVKNYVGFYEQNVVFEEKLVNFLRKSNTYQSKLILSIVNNNLYSNLTRNCYKSSIDNELKISNLERIKRMEKLNCLFWSDTASWIDEETSIMQELTLYYTGNNLNIISAKSDKKKDHHNIRERCEMFKSIGLDGNIDKILGKFFVEIDKKHLQVGELLEFYNVSIVFL